MKKLVYLLSLLALILNFTSCKDPVEESEPVVLINDGKIDIIKELDETKQTFTVDVKSNFKNPKVRISYPGTEKNWLTNISTGSKAEMTTSQFTFQVNNAWNGSTERTAHIIISTQDGKAETTVLVKQSAPAPTLTIRYNPTGSGNYVEETEDQGITVLKIKDYRQKLDLRIDVEGTNKGIKSELFLSGDWASIVSDDGTSRILITVNPALTKDVFDYAKNRQATLQVRTSDGSKTAILKIEQAPRVAGVYQIRTEDIQEPLEGATEDEKIAASTIGKLIDSEHLIYQSDMKAVTISAPADVNFKMTEYDFKAITKYGPKVVKIDISGIEGMTEIPANALTGNAVLEEIVLPQSLKIIGANAFENCLKLAKFNIPPTIAEIRDKAFYMGSTSSMTGTITIPNTLEVLGISAFQGHRFSKITFEDPESEYIKGTIKRLAISNNAFYSSTSNTETSGTGGFIASDLIIPDWVSSIGDQAFIGSGMKAYWADKEARIKIVIGKNVGHIGWGAFALFRNVDEVEFKEGVDITMGSVSGSTAGITNGAFAYTGLKTVTYPMHSRMKGSRMPGSIFNQCEELENIVILEGIDTVGRSAFAGGKSVNLTSITFPSTLKVVEANAFNNIAGVTELNLSHTQLRTVGESGFYKMSGVTSASFPQTLETLENNFLSGWSSLTTLDLSHCTNLKVLPRDCFTDMTSLTTLILPTGLTTLGNNCFKNVGLTSINLSAMTGLKSISDNCFQNSTKLTEIVLPASITSIGSNACSGATGMKNKPMWLPESFRPTSGNYPKGVNANSFPAAALPIFYYGSDSVPTP